MLFEEAINNYLNNSLIVKTKGTYDFEREHLKALFFYLGNISLDNIDFYKIIKYYKDKRLSNNTINKRISLLKRLLKFYNLSFKDVKKLREEVHTFSYLSVIEIEKLIIYLKENLNKNSFLSVRNTLILLVLVDTGIRLNELMQLKKNDLNAKLGFILLKFTKNHHAREVYLSEYTLTVFNYLDHHSQYLFGQQLSYSIIRKIFDNLKKKLDFNKFSPHVLRHSLATNLLISGADLPFVAKVLGHANYSTTKRYLHLNREYMKDTFNKYYPYQKKY